MDAYRLLSALLLTAAVSFACLKKDQSTVRIADGHVATAMEVSASTVSGTADDAAPSGYWAVWGEAAAR